MTTNFTNPQPRASAPARASREAVIQDTLFNTKQHALTSDDYYTPQWVFDKLKIKFDLDVAAPPGGCHWIPATNYYDQETDGLTSDWYGNVFMNPPFSKPKPWVHKFINHKLGIAILPSSNGKWFNEIWDSAEAITIFDFNIKYHSPNKQFLSIPTRTFMFAYGEHNVQALHNIGRVR